MHGFQSDKMIHQSLEGYVVQSTAGRDCGRYYLVLRQEGQQLWLADGKTRPLSKAKKKNRRHIRLVSNESYERLNELAALPCGSGDADRRIRALIVQAKKVNS